MVNTNIVEIKRNQTGRGLLIEHDGYINMDSGKNQQLKESYNSGGDWHCPYPFIVDAVFQKFDIENAKFYEPVGCEYCDNIGYYERIALFEVLCIDEYLKDMIAENKSTIDIKNYAIENAEYKPLIADGIEKVMAGIQGVWYNIVLGRRL